MVALALAAVAEDVSWRSGVLAGVTVLFVSGVVVAGSLADWPSHLLRAAGLPFLGPFRLADDLGRLRHLWDRRRGGRWWFAALSAWFVPIGLSLLFLALFASANPVLDEWLGALDPTRVLERLPLSRLAFWLAALCLLWPLLHVKVAGKPKRAAARLPAAMEDLGMLIGTPSVLRSLVLFNALFALQTGLDMAYLWGGLSLPHGMTYATYAHRGAYPLIATTLLAAAFVLVALRRVGPAAADGRIKSLVLVFVAQNVMLVASSIYRTMLYVEA